MRIGVIVDGRALRFWQVELAHRLREAGHVVNIMRRDAVLAMLGIEFVGQIERFIYDFPDRQAGAVVGAYEAAKIVAEDPNFQADLTIDTIGALSRGPVMFPVLTPLCDDCAGEAAAVKALLAQRAPQLAIEFRNGTNSTPKRVAQGVPGLEESGILVRSFDRTCERLGDLLFQCVERLEAGMLDGVASELAPPARVPSLFAAARFSARTLSTKVLKRFVRMVSIEEHWRIAWRRTRGDAVIDTLAWPTADFTFLPDDGKRFYADPFVVSREGVAYVFCEEYPYATSRGIISLFTIDQNGNVSTPRPILERPYHLSYPFVFERDGQMFMIPETSQNRTIELYRAQEFPDVWTFERVLVDNVSAADVTLHERDGRLWIFATLSDGRRSTWDTLGIFSAPALEGPWEAHPANPVLIDAGSARPAGRMFEYGGVLMRPAQDCRDGYGVGLSLCRIDRLDQTGFAQSVVRRFDPPRRWGLNGLHTLNRDGDIEVVDAKGRRRRP